MLKNFSNFRLDFSPEGGGGGGGDDKDPPDDKDPKDPKDPPAGDEKKFSQADLDRIVKERLERERKKQEADAAKIKSDAEAEALKEQGKHKELAEKAQKDAEAAKAKADEAEKQLGALRMQRAFEKSARELEIEFASEAAAEDAFSRLDLEAVGEDLKGMGDALKKLIKERPYLFADAEPANNDARIKGKKGGPLTEDVIAAKRKSGQYSGV